MSDPPRRYKSIEELTVEDHVARLQALRRGEPEPKFERPEYAIARRQALEAAGLETDDDDEPDPDAPSIHAARRYGEAA